MPDNNKCAHPACKCTVKRGEKYCSQYCNDQETNLKSRVTAVTPLARSPGLGPARGYRIRPHGID